MAAPMAARTHAAILCIAACCACGMGVNAACATSPISLNAYLCPDRHVEVTNTHLLHNGHINFVVLVIFLTISNTYGETEIIDIRKPL